MFKFSIIIPTIGRDKELALNIESVQSQTGNFEKEIIIIDQNSTANFLKPLIDDYREKLNIVHHHVEGKGASYARNVGITLSTGNILLFPDDDCEFTPGLLQKLCKVFEEDSRIDGICVISKDKECGKSMALRKNNQVKIDRRNVLFTVIEHGIVIKKERLQGEFFDEGMGVGSQHSKFWSDEGPDLVLRLINKGARIVFRPDLYFYHPLPTKEYTPKTTNRAYLYGLGRGYFLRKNKYNITYICYFTAIYLAGLALGILKMNKYMVQYFVMGLKGRLQGYFSRATPNI